MDARLEWIASILSGVGLAWARFRRNLKDMNGLGARQRRFEKNLLLYLQEVAENPEQRRRLTELFRE